MVPDAALKEAKRVQSVFGLFDLRERFGGDGAAVFQPRREASRGRLVCHGEAGFAGKCADGGLIKIGFGERSNGVMLCGRALSRPVVGGVVEVATVGDCGKPELFAQSFHRREELVLAVEAALSVVRDVGFALHLAGLQNVQRDVVFAGEGDGRGQFLAGQAGRIGDDGEHIVAQHLVSFVGEISGIDAAGIGNQEPTVLAEDAVEVLAVCDQLVQWDAAFAVASWSGEDCLPIARVASQLSR